MIVGTLTPGLVFGRMMSTQMVSWPSRLGTRACSTIASFIEYRTGSRRSRSGSFVDEAVPGIAVTAWDGPVPVPLAGCWITTLGAAPAVAANGTTRAVAATTAARRRDIPL